MAIGDKVKQFQKDKEERKQRERLKKFPSMAITGRKMPVSRQGAITDEEKAVVQLLVQDQPQDLSKEQITALSSLMRRNVPTIINLVQQAREKFESNARSYVDLHLQSTRAAYSACEFDVAARHAEWAMENMSSEGVPLLETLKGHSNGKGPQTPTVLIGVKVGGV